MTKVLILGASATQQPLIKTLKERGFYTVVVSNQIDEQTQDMDEFLEISITNFPKLKELIVEKDISRALTIGSDLGQLTVIKLAEHFGWENVASLETFERLHLKDLVREKLLEERMTRIPLVVRTDFEQQDFNFENQKSYVVKPVDGYGSKGVNYVQEYNNIELLFKKAKAFSTAKKVLIEPLLEGKHITLEFFVGEETTVPLLATQKVINDNMVPFAYRSIKRSKFKGFIEKVSDALELDKGFYNVDALQTDDGIELLDIAPRLGGNYLSTMYREIFDKSLLDELIDYLINGVEPNYHKPDKVVGLYILHSDKKINVKGINIPDEYPLIDSSYPSFPKEVEPLTESRFQIGYLLYEIPKKLNIVDFVNELGEPLQYD